MSGHTAAALCLAVFFATAAAPRGWVAAAWNALAAAVEGPAAEQEQAPETGPPGGWLIDPNG